MHASAYAPAMWQKLIGHETKSLSMSQNYYSSSSSHSHNYPLHLATYTYSTMVAVYSVACVSQCAGQKAFYET